MRVAVIDHVGNPGGGSRVVRALLPALKTLRPDIKITYFGNPITLLRESLEKELSEHGITVHKLKSTKLATVGIFGIRATSIYVQYAQMKCASALSPLPVYFSGAVHREIEHVVRNVDLCFFPWPYMMACPTLNCPMVGIFHDFNFKYYFSGTTTFHKWQLEFLNREMPEWLRKSTPIVSTYFMKEELEKFYPDSGSKVKVVYLAPMSSITRMSTEEAEKTVSNLGIQKRYILYPTNVCSHKNIGPLMAALPILNAMGHSLTLVLTGPGTEIINGHACDIGIELGEKDKDVFGLGYVSNAQMDSLIQCASVVASTSLYEAGNGPGIDAWVRGVSVAMSNIPAFLEHLRVQDVRAEVFDPRSPADIANKIHNILSNPEKAKADAAHSRKAIETFTWAQTAGKYLDIFDESIEKFVRD